MSGYLRFCFVAFFLAGLSTVPASSNPFDALFNSTPAEATAPAPVEEECLPQPGKSTADGQHWVYRYDGHRKCWFQAAEGTVKKPIHRVARHRVAAPKENESPLRTRKAAVDARDELLSSAPTEAAQPTPPAREVKVVDAASAPAMGSTALVPPAPVVAKPATDQFIPDQPMPRQVDVEKLLADAPAASDADAASVPPAPPAAAPIHNVRDGRGGWTVNWLGMSLIALGLVSLLISSSRILRVGRAGRDISPSEDEVDGHRGRRTPEPSFAFDLNTFNRPVANEKLFRPHSARPAI